MKTQGASKNFHASAARVGFFAAVSYVVDYSFQLVDIFWVARIGPGAPTAVAIISSVFYLILALNEIVGVSTVPIFSQAAGSGDKRRTGFVIFQALITKFCLGLGMAAAFAGFLIWLAPLYAVDSVTRAYLYEYGGVIWLSLILMPAYSSMMTALRTIGEEGKTAAISIAALVLNAVLNPVLIFGFGNFEGMGVVGAAWATVAAQLAALAGAAVFLVKNRLGVKVFDWAYLVFDRCLVRDFFMIGLPVGGVMILYNLEQTGITAIVAGYPAAVSDGYGIGARIYGFLFMGVFGISVGVSVTVGHCIGRGDLSGVQVQLPRFAAGAAALTAFAAAALFFAGHGLMGVFTASADAAATGALYLRYMGVGLCFMCLMYSYNAAFEGAGRNLPVLFVAAVMYLCIELPMIVIALLRPDFALADIWLIIVAASAFGAGLSMWLFRQKRWMPAAAGGAR